MPPHRPDIAAFKHHVPFWRDTVAVPAGEEMEEAAWRETEPGTAEWLLSVSLSHRFRLGAL